VAFDPGQSEQRHKSGDDDRGGEKDRSVDLDGGAKDRPQFAAEAGRAGEPTGAARPRRVVAAGPRCCNAMTLCNPARSSVSAWALVGRASPAAICMTSAMLQGYATTSAMPSQLPWLRFLALPQPVVASPPAVAASTRQR
jgi:hypothetical protein